MKHIVFVFGLVTLAACAVPQGGMGGVGGMKRSGGGSIFGAMAQPAPQVQAQQYAVDEVIEVLTEPAGARVHINDAFAGYAPVRAVAHRVWRGEPGRMVLDTVKVEALPVAGGQCVQSAFFGQNSAKSPPQVKFNMASCAAAQSAK